MKLVLSGSEAALKMRVGTQAVLTPSVEEQLSTLTMFQDFFLGTGLNLVLWTELLLVAGVCLLVSFYLKGTCITVFQNALQGCIGMQ